MSVNIYAGLTAIFVAVVIIQKLGVNNRKRFPPGPKPLPIIGNALDYPKHKAWLTFADWKEKYGDVVYLNIFGKPMLIVNSHKACKELLDKRSAKYSDRPRLVMLNELMGWDYNFAVIGYSPRWRNHRRLFHLHFHETMAQGYRHIQERSTHSLLRRLLATPNDLQGHIRLLFGETILEVVYGITPKGAEDPFVKNAQESVWAFSQGGVPGRWLVDTFPFLKYIPSWMPGAGFKRQAKEWRKVVMSSRDLPSQHVVNSLKDGTARPSVLASILTNCESKGEEDTEEMPGNRDDESPQDAAINSCAVAYVAGADTTLSAIQAFFLLMANNPECQKKGQAELDAVVGKLRLPSFEDLEDLPYIVAITKELLRWHVITPVSLPHALSEDDEYQGYFIPKGSVVLPNTWLLLHDPEVYPEPEAFKPERWIIDTPTGRKLNLDVPEPEAAFGYGRRACPGRHFARASLFITVASTLACYNIKALDESGRPAARTREEFTDGLLTYPLPYNISVLPRSEKAAQLVKDTANLHG